MTEDSQLNVPVRGKNDADEVSLLDLVLVLAKHKKLIVGLPIIVGLLAAVFAFNIPNEYTATLKIAPSKNAAAYNWILNNDQVLEQVSNEMKLSDHYGTKGRKATRKEMATYVKVALNVKDSYLDVNATDKDPEFAAKLANKLGEALQNNLYEMRLLESSKGRYDLEVRRAVASENKAKFDQQVKQPELAGTIAQLSPADRYAITSLAAIQAESTLQGTASDRTVADLMQNEVIRLQDQLASLQRLLVDGMKKGGATNTGLWIAAIESLQQQAYWSALVERLDGRIALVKKTERDELKMTPAEVPDEKSGPKRATIVLLSTFIALLVAVVWSFFAEAMIKSRENSGTLALLGKISAALRSK